MKNRMLVEMLDMELPIETPEMAELLETFQTRLGTPLQVAKI